MLQGCGWETFLRRIPWIEQFYPDKIVQDTAYSPVVITDIKVHNVSVRTYPLSVREGIAANRAIDFIDKIVLGYRENNFSLDFSILNYINPELNRYLYRLERDMTRNGCPLRLDVGLPIITIFRQVLILFV